MRNIFMFSIFAGLTALALRYPFSGVITYYWLSLMNPQSLVWGDLGVPWVKLVAIVTLVAWIFGREPKKIPTDTLVIFAVSFCLWTAVTSVFALYSGAWEDFIDFGKVIMMILVAIALTNTRARLHAFVWMIVISVGYWVTKGGLWVLISPGINEVRGPPAYQQNNEMARATVMVLPFFYYLYLQSANRYVRIVMFGSVLLGILALIGTNSAGGFIGLAGMLGFAWLNSRRKILLSLAGILVIGMGILLLPGERIAGWLERIDKISEYETNESALSRYKSWNYAIDMANRHPITGGGFNAFNGNLLDKPKLNKSGSLTLSYESHNNYFQVLGEHGYVGLALFTFLNILTFLRGYRIRRRTRRRPELYWARDLATMVQISVVGYMVGGITINHSYFEFFYMLVAIMVVTDRLVTQALAATEKPEHPPAVPAWRASPVPSGLAAPYPPGGNVPIQTRSGGDP